MNSIFIVPLSEGKAINLAQIFHFEDISEGGQIGVAVILANGEEHAYYDEDAKAIFRELEFFTTISAALKAQYSGLVK